MFDLRFDYMVQIRRLIYCPVIVIEAKFTVDSMKMSNSAYD